MNENFEVMAPLQLKAELPLSEIKQQLYIARRTLQCDCCYLNHPHNNKNYTETITSH